MSENETTSPTRDDPVESGALEDEDDLDAQQGKGYGADEGEREDALEE